MTAPDRSLVAEVRALLAGDPGPVTAEAVARAVRRTGRLLGDESLLALIEVLQAEFSGAGPLQPLVDDERVTDVLVNGPDRAWVDRGAGLEAVPPVVRDEAELRALAVRLAAVAGRRLDDAVPFADARLPNGVRFHAVLPPLAPLGTHISLRVPRRRHLSFADLVTAGTVPPGLVGVLRALVAGRASFLISGGTGSGKTTLLGAMLGEVPPAERLVVVEDSRELDPVHPHVVHLEARRPNAEGTGGVGLAELLRQALRMRPDRIVVGECRGPEVRELLSALNTGHDGGCGTVHANAVDDVPARLEALGALAGLGRDAVAAQAVSALDVVLHIERRDGHRLLTTVGVVGRGRAGLQVHVAVSHRDGVPRTGPGHAELVARWPPVRP